MSDLHKKFLQRIKNHEVALGLDISPQQEAPTAPQDTHGIEAAEKAALETFPVQNTYTNGDISLKSYYKPAKSTTAPVFCCHHGAGLSGMTFCRFAQVLETCDPDAGVFVMDARGHGLSTNTTPPNYELAALVADFAAVLDRFVVDVPNSLYLVGHSLGGSVLTAYVKKHHQHNVRGLVMIDAVEETALKSLEAMPVFIRNRPPRFDSVHRAIDWHTSHIHLLNNLDSARISIPHLLRQTPQGLVWRTELADTQPFWQLWFTGLSEDFILCNPKVAKLLILSGHETLDTNLIIGQMQGKYQLIVFNNTAETGHFVQEDIPKHLALSLLDFVRRNDKPEEYMKRELGIVPKWGGQVNK